MFRIRLVGGLAVFLLLCAVPAAAQLIFDNVSAEAGLSGVRYHSPTDHSLGINWIDFDNDYHADLFLVNGGGDDRPHLYRNNGNATFTNVDELLPPLPGNVDFSHSVFADYDNDGDSDIYIFVDNRAFTGVLRLNREDGPANLFLKNLWVENGGRALPGVPLFEEIARQAGVDDLADQPVAGATWPGLRAKTGGWLDYDRDGCVDLFVGHLVFGPIGQGRPSTRNRLYRNRCDGTFEDATASSGVDDGTNPFRFRPTLAFIGAHLDSDLWPDMYEVNASTDEPYHRDVLFRNNADGTFRNANSESPGIGDDAEAGMGIDVADIDLDGDWDMYISDLLNTRTDQPPRGNPLYLGNGDGTFADNSAPQAGVAGFNSWGVTFFDADQDAYEDLLVATMLGRDEPFMYRNNGDGTFADLTQFSGMLSINGRGTAVADYDGDGDLDAAIVNQGGPLSLYRSVAPLQGYYLRVRLRARQSNRSAIGTVVKVKAGPYNMMRQIKGGSSAHSQDEMVAHFGLRFESVDEVRVYWPSGVEDVIQTLAPNQTITVAEGTTATLEPYVHAYPSYVDLGVSGPEGVNERTIRVMNEGAGPLTITGLTCKHPSFSVVSPEVPFELGPYGESRDVVVRFNGSAGGLQQGDLEIASDNPSTPVTTVTLAGTSPGPTLRERINPARSRLRSVGP